MAVTMTTFAFALALFPSTVAGVVQSDATESAVRGLAEYLCSRQGPIAVEPYYRSRKIGNGQTSMELRPPDGGAVELMFKDDEWSKADNALQELGANGTNQESACIAELMEALLPERASSEPMPAQAQTFPPEPTTRSRNFTFSERNGHCSPDRQFRIPVRASAGWRIVVDSIEVSVNTSSKSSFAGVYPAPGGEFELVGNVINNGTCGPFWRDGRGHVWGGVSFTEEEVE